jgi:hypothetical protein
LEVAGLRFEPRAKINNFLKILKRRILGMGTLVGPGDGQVKY